MVESGASLERDAPALISVVIPMFNEQESVRPLLERLEATLRPLGIPFEVVAVDDGSGDSTRERLLGFHPFARELSVVCLSRNFGLEGAIEAGLRHARGDVVVLMDADLQDPPELIPTLLDAWRNGAEVVFTTKRTRAEPLARRAAFGGFHLLYHRLARIPSPLGAETSRSSTARRWMPSSPCPSAPGTCPVSATGSASARSRSHTTVRSAPPAGRA
jgi:glycosyltransferase involved in cell wall biosynthesis